MGKQNRQQTRAKQPVSRHPLFPAVVAIWFGALFGLGSLALRASLLEAIVLSTHIDAVISAAAPPLGMTARILLALIMAAVGAAIGGMIARWIARPRQEVRERKRNAASTAASHKAVPEYVDNPAFVPATGRRRVLAVAEDNEPQELHDAAPLPGGPPEILDVNDFDLAEPEIAALEPMLPQPAVEPAAETIQPPETAELDLTGFSEPGRVAAMPEPSPAQDSPALDSTFAPEPVATETAPAALGRLFDGRLPVAAVAPAPHAVSAYAGDTNAIPVVNAPTASNMFTAAAAIPPINFDAPASPIAPVVAEGANGAEIAPTPIAAPVAQVSGIVDRLAAAEPAPAARFPLPEGQAARRIATAPLADLSPVELIERLALSLQARRGTGTLAAQASIAAPAAAIESREPPLQAPDFLAAAEPVQPAIVASAAAIGMPMPAALRPIAFTDPDEDADDDGGFVPARSMVPARPEHASTGYGPADDAADAAQSSVPATLAELASRFAVPPIVPSPEPVAELADEAEPETDEDVAEDSYSSLLDLNRPAPRGHFIRVDDGEADGMEIEPVVIFPGQGQATGGRFSAPITAPAAEPVASAATEAPQAEVTGTAQPIALRRFDAPADPAAQTAATSPAAVPAPAADPLETEQALRSALATLQRMSGAA